MSDPLALEPLQPLLEQRLDLDEAQAKAALAALSRSTELCAWLRSQYVMDGLLMQALSASSADFPNRLAVASSLPATEAFLRRVSASRRARSARQPLLRTWLPSLVSACAALLLVGLGAWMAWRMPVVERAGTVITGEVEVDRAHVDRIPLGSDFVVAGHGNAVIALGTEGRAELAPASQASITMSTDGSGRCHLVSGSGRFALHGQDRIDAGTASVSGDGAHLAAEWLPPPTTESASRPAIPAARSLKLEVSSGNVRVVSARGSQVLHPHETLVLDVVRGPSPARSRRGLHGQVWAIARQATGWALAVGDAKSQRTCILPLRFAIVIDGQPGDCAQIQRGDSIDVQFAVDHPDLVAVVVIHRASGTARPP